MNRAGALLAVLVLAAPVAAAADEAHDLAVDIMRKTKADTLMSTMTVLIRSSVVQTVMTKSGKTREEAEQIVDEIVMPSVRAAIPGLEASMADLYVQDFSVEDLRGLDKFYDTTLGRHLVDKMPLVLAQTQPIVRSFAQQLMSDILRKQSDRLRQKGVSL